MIYDKTEQKTEHKIYRIIYNIFFKLLNTLLYIVINIYTIEKNSLNKLEKKKTSL